MGGTCFLLARFELSIYLVKENINKSDISTSYELYIIKQWYIKFNVLEIPINEFSWGPTQRAFTCSKLTKETQEQGDIYFQS